MGFSSFGKDAVASAALIANDRVFALSIEFLAHALYATRKGLGSGIAFAWSYVFEQSCRAEILVGMAHEEFQ